MAIEDFTKYLGTEVKFVNRPFPNEETLKHIELHIQGRITDVIIKLNESENEFSVDDGDYYFFSDVEFLSEFTGQPNMNVRNELGTLAATS